MKIIALIGSLRTGSYNKQLIETMQERYGDKFDIEIANIGALPHYNEDIELSPGETVGNFKKQIADADGIFISTAEFNWSIPGVLKNALDWLSRVDKPINGKLVLPLGVSGGALGTVRAQQHLRQVLSSMGIQAKVLPPAGNEVYIGQAQQKFENGKLTDEATLNFLDQVVEHFIKFTEENK